ncbi:hypothetical protein F1559_004500 [Cyanidiococcus yangmingshanensis]|uniref:Sugar phosphate transporter domain-containing protein n=1 Tax=Cyanidiococcus yangmingshanensis TaxID=2690220 RepID=A0A7J7IK10_9RHOD|nr:hypothetical protein F1559_004500 [Cyanidiococcus yangmingshanensis]
MLPSPWISAALYTLTSLLGVLVNKAVFSTFDFPFPLVILLGQLIVTSTALLLVWRGFPTRPSCWWPLVAVAACFVLNVFTGLVALESANLPMFSAFRRLSAVAVMIFEAVFLGRRETAAVERAVGVMTLGSVLAAIGEINADWLGYIYVMLNNCATALYLVTLKRASARLGRRQLDSLTMTFYTNLFAIPMALVAAWCFELRRVEDRPNAVDALAEQLNQRGWAFASALLLSSASALAVNVTTLWCTATNTPLVTAIAGQTKNLLQTALGFILWEYHFTALNAFGLTLAAFGSAMFVHAKFMKTPKPFPSG